MFQVPNVNLKPTKMMVLYEKQLVMKIFRVVYSCHVALDGIMRVFCFLFKPSVSKWCLIYPSGFSGRVTRSFRVVFCKVS